MFAPISVGAYIYQQIVGSPGGEHTSDDNDELEDGDDLEVESPDVEEQNGSKSPTYDEVVEEIPLEVASYKPDESAPRVGEILQALTGDEEASDKDDIIKTTNGGVNDNLQKQTLVQSSDEGLVSGSDDSAPEANDVAETRDDAKSSQNDVTRIPFTKDAESNLEVVNTQNNFDGLDPDEQEEEQSGELTSESDNEELVDREEYLNEDDKSDTDDMENRLYSSPEPEVPFTQSKVESVELPNINCRLESLKNIPPSKPANKPDTSPPKYPRKVTDEEVEDALRFLLGRGARVPRVRSAMDLRDESARKLRGTGKPEAGARAFILVMMPDGTQKRVSVDRRPSLGNELDSTDDQMHKLEEALRDLTPKKKIPKNEFDGREERPPTPREVSTSPSSASSKAPSDIEEIAADIRINPESSDSPSPIYSSPDQKTKNKYWPKVRVHDNRPVSSDIDEKPHSEDFDDIVVPTSYKPSENNFDLSNLERLRPDDEVKPAPVSKEPGVIPTSTSNVSVDDLVNLLPRFEGKESEDDGNDTNDIQTPVVEIKIQVSAPVVPEESSVDLNILEKKQPEAAAPSETRSHSTSDASSRSGTRPQSSSDASSRSTEWQEATIDFEDTEDEIVPESKTPTETPPDLRTLEKLRPAGMAAPSPVNDEVEATSSPETIPAGRSNVTVVDLEHMLPDFDNFSEPREENRGTDRPTTPVKEEYLSAMKVSPEESQVNLAGLKELDDSDTEYSRDDSRPYDVSDILDDLSSEEEDWPAPPEKSEEMDWPAAPDSLHESSMPTVGHKHRKEDDLPPPRPPPPQNEITKPPAIVITASPEDITVDSDSLTPINESDEDIFEDQDQKVVEQLSSSDSEEEKRHGSSAEPRESSVDPPSFGDVKDDSSDEGTSVDVITTFPKEDAIVSVICKPNESTPNLSNLERLRPEGVDEVYQDSSQPMLNSGISSKERAKVADLEDLIPRFDSASDSDDDQEQLLPPVVEEDISISEATCAEESSFNLSELDRNLKHVTKEPADEGPNDKDVSTDWQEATLDLESENEVESISLTPIKTTPDLSSLEKLRPPGTESPPLAESDIQIPDQPETEAYPSGSGPVSVSELEDMVPAFESSSEEDEEPNSHVPVVEESCESSTISSGDNDFRVDLAKLNQPSDELDDEPIPRKESELSTESQEITMDFGESEDEEIVVPISHVPVESTPDLVELERKLRPSGTQTPEAVSDTEFQPDNRLNERTGATVEDLKDLLPTFDTTSESSECESSEPTTPVDEMIEEIGSVSPTRTHFNFGGLESLRPKEFVESPHTGALLADFAQQKSEDIIVEAYLSLIREERVMELLKTFSKAAAVVNGLDENASEEEPIPVIGIKEKTSSSPSAENESSSAYSDNEMEHEVSEHSKSPEVELHTPDSPSKKRRSVGYEVGDDSDDETPAKKPKTFELLEEEKPETSEPIIIEASISVFREESITESPPPAVEPKPSTDEEINDEEWPAPPPPEMLVKEDWPAPPPEAYEDSEPCNLESGKEDMDAEDTSSVSTSSTEGEYVTEPSPSGTDRVFVLTVIPQLETFNEEDEEGESENTEEKADEKPAVNISISPENIPDQSESKSSGSSESDTESSTAGDKRVHAVGTNDVDDRPPHLDSQSDEDTLGAKVPDKDGEDEIETNVLSQPEELEPRVSISAAESVESAPHETSEIQPGYYQPSSKVDNLEKEVLDPETQPMPVIGNDKNRESSSDTSSSEDTSITHAKEILDDGGSYSMTNDPAVHQEMEDAPSDEKMESENETEESDQNGQKENIEYAPAARDSEADSASAESSEGADVSPFSPSGSRVFILTGLPSFPVRDDVSDVEDDIPAEVPQGTENVDPLELKQSQHEETMPELIPVKSSPTEETPEYTHERPVEIEPIEDLESAPVITHRVSSDSENDAVSSPADVVVAADVQAPNVPSSSEINISPRTASDTFSAPTVDASGEAMSAIPESPPDKRIPEELGTFEEPHDAIYEQERVRHSDHEGTHQDTGLDWHEPEQPTLADNTYSEPHSDVEIPPSPPSETHEWSSSPNLNWPSQPTNHDSAISIPSDRYTSSLGQPTEQSGRGPSLSHYIPTGKSSNIINATVPNLAPQFSINSKQLTDDSLQGSDTEITQFRPKETDINEPAVPNLAPYMPISRNTDITDPATFVPIRDPISTRSTDIVDPATQPAYDFGVLPSKVTDINDPGSVPYEQESKSTDITDPAVPEIASESPRQRSPFEPIDMEASPMKFGNARPVTPVETETSLVPPDVYTSDAAYEQFQMQYRGNLDDAYDTIPEMRPTRVEPAKSKRKEEKSKKKTPAVSDMPSYMAPPPPVQNEVARTKGKKVPPPIPPRIESDPLLREPTPLNSISTDITDPALQPYLRDQPERYRPDEPGVMMRHDRPITMDMDEPPLPYQSSARSMDLTDPRMPYSTRPKSMELPVSYHFSARSTDITDPATSYPTRSMSTNFLPEPAQFNHSRPTHAKSMDIPTASMPYRVQPRSRSTDLTDPAVPYPSNSRSTDITEPGSYFPSTSKTTDITDPGFEPPVPRPTKAVPEYLVPNRGPIPDINKPPPARHKDIELENLKRQLHRLGTKMASTRQQLDGLKRNNPANRYASPVDRTAHSRGSSRSSIDSPEAEITDLQFSRKFFASLTDKEFGKMLEEMRRYRMEVRNKGADLKRLSKQCDGIRLRLKQLGEPMDYPDANTNVKVGAIETTI